MSAARFLFLLVVVCLFSAITALPASAHRVSIFAWTEGDQIVTESQFSKKSKVHHGTVEVRDKGTDNLLFTGTTDDSGVYSFPVAKVQDARDGLVLRIIAGEGHQGEWNLQPSEYLSQRNESASTSAPPSEQWEFVDKPSTEEWAFVDPPEESTHSPQDDTNKPPLMVIVEGKRLQMLIQQAVDTAMEQKVAPLRRMLAEQQDKRPGLNEITGGIGWIIGLFGVVAYMKSRGRRS